MPSARSNLGRFGEQAALVYLLRHGYTLLDRNWRCRYGEIDLVVQSNDQVVFVEVRTRRGDASVVPEESVGPAKQQRLVLLAAAYIEAAGLDPQTQRIDVIAVIVDSRGRVVRLTHYVAAVPNDP
jgi:putative endonuclease